MTDGGCCKKVFLSYTKEVQSGRRVLDVQGLESGDESVALPQVRA